MKSKVKKITVELTAREVDVLEDMLFIEVSEEELRRNKKTRLSLWEKIAMAFDSDENEGVSTKS